MRMKINKLYGTPAPYVAPMAVVEGTLWFGKRILGRMAVQRAVVRFGGYVLTMDFGTS